MAHEISLRLRADPSDAEKGLKRLEGAVEEWLLATRDGTDDVADKLETVISTTVDVGKQVGKTKEEIVRDLRGIGLSADDAADAFKTVERAAADAGDTGADGLRKVDEATSTTGDGLRSLGDIAKDVLEGDFGGAAQGAIGALAGIAGVAGIGGAVGSSVLQALGGLVGAMVEEFDIFGKKSAEIRDGVAADLIAVGGAFTAADLESEMRAIASDTDKMAQAQLISAGSGRDLSEVLLALAGDAGSLEAVMGDYDKAMRDAFENGIVTNAMKEAGAALEATAEGLTIGADRAKLIEQAMARAGDETDALLGKTKGLAQGLGEIPPEVIVKMRVDESEWLAWQRKPRQFTAGVVVRPGQVQYTG